MRKGLKKFTVPYEGKYYDGTRVFGLKIVFAENEIKARYKAEIELKNRKIPILYVGKAVKWEFEDETVEEIFPYWI